MPASNARSTGKHASITMETRRRDDHQDTDGGPSIRRSRPTDSGRPWRHGSCGSERPRENYALPMSKTDIANHLCTMAIHLSRTLQDSGREGLATVSCGRISMPDPDSLAQHCGGGDIGNSRRIRARKDGLSALDGSFGRILDRDGIPRERQGRKGTVRCRPPSLFHLWISPGGARDEEERTRSPDVIA